MERITLPTLAVGTVEIKYKDGFELKSKRGLFIGTEESVNDPEANIAELAATCERLSIPIENVVSVTLEGKFLPPPPGLEDALNSESPSSNVPHTDGLIIVRK